MIGMNAVLGRRFTNKAYYYTVQKSTFQIGV